MPRRASNSLKRSQNRVLRAIANGATLSPVPKQPQLAFVHGKGGGFKTQQSTLRGLIEDDLLLMIGKSVLNVEITQKGLAILDRLGKNLTRSRLPEVLHPLVRPIALQKLAELRLVGFEDPVDALLAVAFETDDEGEWKHPVEIRLDALKAAAPFCRPKLQAILARSDTGKGHVEWLKELKGYVEQEECEANGEDGPVIEHATANGNDPEPLAPEPDEPKDGEAVSEPAEPSWKPQSK